MAEKTKKEVAITATYYSRDIEGAKVLEKFIGKGANVAEALKELAFPKGTNCLVNVLAVGDRKIEKALAPHKARELLGKQNAEEFLIAFKGLINE